MLRVRRRIAWLAITSVVCASLLSMGACGLDLTGGPAPPPEAAPDTRGEASLPDPADDATTDAIPSDGPSEAAPGRCAREQGLRGPDMVEIPDAGFCIDSTEVTNAQYDEMIAELGDAGQDGGTLCGEFSVIPAERTLGGPDAPIASITFCQADAFCRWAGKRLCAADQDGGDGEWRIACSRNGERPWPYGSTEEVGRCNVFGVGFESVPARDGGCAGGYEGLYDMIGNAAEWVAACNGPACLALGGSWFSPLGASCGTVDSVTGSSFSGAVGVRCCR